MDVVVTTSMINNALFRLNKCLYFTFSLALRTTGPGGLDPYRLFNLDVFEYELDSTMAIYGAIPVAYAHSPKYTVGIFWHNAAETWVDVNNSKDGNVMSSLVNLVSGSKSETNVNIHFMSESGILDMFILMGPTPKDAVKQYASLTGTKFVVFLS